MWHQLFSDLIYKEEAGILNAPLGSHQIPAGVWVDDPQTHSEPLPQGPFSSSLLSFSLCLESVQLQPRSLLLFIAITLLQLHIAKLECPFMCSEGKLCSALLWVSKEPSPGLVL